MSASRILRTRDVLERLNVGRSTLADWRRNGRFPQPIPLGPNAVGWLEDDVDAWLNERRN